MVVRIPVKRLEQALCDWEQQCFLHGSLALITQGLTGNTSVPYEGPLRYWRGFRRHLLESYNIDFDPERFVGEGVIAQALESSTALPASLFSWTIHSRREYRLSSDMIQSLLKVPLDEVTWNDIPWPYYSLGLNLEVPIKDDKGRDYDFILLSLLGDKYITITEIRLFPTQLEQIKLFSRREMERISDLIARRRWQRAHVLLRRLLDTDDLVKVPTIAYWRLKEKFGEPILSGLDSINDVRGDFVLNKVGSFVEIEQAIRISVGFCFYLDSLPPSVARYNDIPVERRSTPDPSNVTFENGVCYLSHRGALVTTSHYTSGDRKGMYEMPTHWRRSHKRRMPGEGRNPEAPRVVRIPPSLIRKDRLIFGAVPGGNLTKVG